MKTIATFQISYLQYLNEQHESVQPFPAFATPNFLLDVYKRMTLLRVFDTQMVNLHRTGKIGTFPSSQGQEALFVAIGLAMAKEDVLCSFYRDHGTLIQRAYALTDILAYWAGDERGNLSNPNNHDFPICIPIAGQCLHATGVAYAINYRHEKKAVVTSVGDGGTSKGDFYEAMNLAGAWQLPVVFVIDNNQWAISVPREKQTASQTLAQKAIAAGLDCLQVDGNDVIAVFDAMKNALTQARDNHKATVIEALSYRLADHTTVDDASRYSDAEEKKAAWKKEPIARLGFYLESKQLWNRDKEAALQHECKIIVEKAFQDYFARDKQKPTSMFDYLFEQLPNADIDQYNELL
ncbi:MAG: pyruvate dehydrogenase (acetyl-transferring) E1 component subunit alpha [Gammaproteobacteria bacterium RIFCSPLOWO2_02_FULL_42_14]|nr:MAG: pyruvate dehydrogenase (acetyl-transferring) E1 component subunit alpha [Gammaproteobacteria bacterium RIFCSPHIGHO2_02_FULL_42_43]OGT52425.1 MAG: pyruvate dehydrogenase (acetyl-transferring) E1 component subunit alpha [Gammaproteobacteria bacterium RIFCSPHIGHO2_12_FULL_41_25]OGT63359.1 MAG: pyruvate dehydrogenase (acetyl-transferring) E1 component subunit alpha [Gammaproteobacteria bacterium RIFCSPLOWO2_02_FULL_42_14]OGT86444.1 MAG: pyruvate dehydrogenase (acetyl-transferring) E1 compone